MIVLGDSMVVTKEDIEKVLALYDQEDIPYILSDFVLKKMVSSIATKPEKKKVKVKAKGDKNDRTRR